MPRESSSKSERQYEHIKESARARGESTRRAQETAARTVDRERARQGESKTAGRTSTRGSSGSRAQSYDQLCAEARQRDIRGRSRTDRQEPAHALGR